MNEPLIELVGIQSLKKDTELMISDTKIVMLTEGFVLEIKKEGDILVNNVLVAGNHKAYENFKSLFQTTKTY